MLSISTRHHSHCRFTFQTLSKAGLVVLASFSFATAQDNASPGEREKSFAPLGDARVGLPITVSKHPDAGSAIEHGALDGIAAIKAMTAKAQAMRDRETASAKATSDGKVRAPKFPAVSGRSLLDGVQPDVAPDGAQGGGAGVVNDCVDCEVGVVGCGETIEGELPVDTCTENGPRARPMDMYAFELTETRAVTIEMASEPVDTYLHLFDADCNEIAANDDHAGSFDLSHIALDLSPGNYVVGCSSYAAGEFGAYTLTVVCDEPVNECEVCNIGTVECNGDPITATLPGNDCLTESPRRGSPYDLYSFSIEETAVVTAEMTSVPVDTYLYLLDENCVELAYNDDFEFGNFDFSRITMSLEPGDYVVACSSYGATETGEYALTVACLTDFDFCPECTVGSIACGETAAGVFPSAESPDACVRPTGQRIDLHDLELADASTIVVTLTGTYDTWLNISSDDCSQEIAFNDDAPGLGLNSQVSIALDAGNYKIGVSSFASGQVGDYTLEVSCPETGLCEDCLVGTVLCGESIAGSLSAEDCVLEDGSRVDLYALDLIDLSNLTIQLGSDSFNTVVGIVDANCEVLDSNDNCVAGELALSCLELAQFPAGSYFVMVTSADADETGDYTLTVDCAPFDICIDCVRGEVECNGDQVTGVLDDRDCKLGDGTSIDLYSFTLDSEREISISLESAEFNTYLFLVDENCDLIAQVDNCPEPEGTTDACIEGLLLAGNYFIIANGFTNADLGEYKVSVTCALPPPLDLCELCEIAGEIGCNETIEGALSVDGDCVDAAGAFVDLYQFEHAGGPLEVSMATTEPGTLDTFLIVVDEDCFLQGLNDDAEPGNFDLSVVSFDDLPAGTYGIAATSFAAGEEGAYSLTISVPECGPAGGLVLPCDFNSDGRVDLSDAVALLNHLFLGGGPPACGDGTREHPSNVTLLDANGDGGIDISDAAYKLQYLFLGGPPPVGGTDCIVVSECESTCVEG